MVVLALNDETMVIEDNCGYINGEIESEKEPKKDVVHYDRIVKIRKEVHEEAELGHLGMPSEEEISKFLLNDIPLPSKVKYESMTDAEIESMVPTTAQIMETMLKSKKQEPKPTAEADGLPSTEDIAAAMGVKLPKESV